MTLRLEESKQTLIVGERLKKLFYSALDSKLDDEKEFKNMIQNIVKGFNVNLNDHLGHYTTPINYLLFQRSYSVFEKVKILVELGADVNYSDKNGLTALYFSVMKFDYGEKLNYLNRELTDVVKYLLDKGANPFYKPEQDVIKGIKRPLPFHEAAKNEYYESFNLIFKNMTNWGKMSREELKTSNKLNRKMYVEYLRWMKKEQEDCNWLQELIDRISEQPIRKEEREIFLKTKNIPNRKKEVIEILKLNGFAYFDEYEIIKYMEEDKSTVIQSIDEKGNSLIVYAFLNFRKEIIRWFVLNGIDLLRKNSVGNDSFYVAAYMDECLDELYNKGEEVKRLNFNRWLNICIKERDNEFDRETEITKIQALCRGYLKRKLIKSQKFMKDLLNSESKASEKTKNQKKKARKKAREREEKIKIEEFKIKKEKSILLIQRNIRKFLIIKNEKNSRNAITLQKFIRNYFTTRKYQLEKQIVIIQSLIRMYLSKNNFSDMKTRYITNQKCIMQILEKAATRKICNLICYYNLKKRKVKQLAARKLAARKLAAKKIYNLICDYSSERKIITKSNSKKLASVEAFPVIEDHKTVTTQTVYVPYFIPQPAPIPMPIVTHGHDEYGTYVLTQIFNQPSVKDYFSKYDNRILVHRELIHFNGFVQIVYSDDKYFNSY